MSCYQFAGHPVLYGDASQLEALLEKADGDHLGTVIDLRTFLEIGEQTTPKPPEGWGYRRLPLTGTTISEQDLDVFRREILRRPQTVVIGPNLSRGEFLLSASLARHEKTPWEPQVQQSAQGEEAELQQWLTSYLVRHGLATGSAIEPTVEMEAVTDGGADLAAEPTVELSAIETATASSKKPKSRSSKKR